MPHISIAAIIISNASYQLGRLVVVVVPAPRRPPPRATLAQSVPGEGGGNTYHQHSAQVP